MTKFKIEIPISILATIIGIVVVTMGYFSYQSLSDIVYSINKGTRPDSKIFVIKDLASDLTTLENAVRLYSLTNNRVDLDAFYALEDKIIQKVKDLNDLKADDVNEIALIDSVSKYSQEKLDLWNEILKIHLSKKGIFPAFSEFYTNLDSPAVDSVRVDTAKNELPGTVVAGQITASDSVSSEKQNEKKEIRKNIQKLEWDIYQSRKKRDVRESKLIEQNLVIVEKINRLINEAENNETQRLIEKTVEADQLANETYKKLAIFTGSAVFLLFLALLVLFIYLRKSRSVQRALTDAREKAETLAHAKEQFAANVSHELRTPVNAIFGLSEQVLRKKLDSDVSEMVSIIFKSAGHLRNIVNDTLDYSKILSGNLVFEAVEFSPSDVFNEVYLLFKNEAENKGISLKYWWECEKPDSLVGDPLRLKQIVINLTGNAIKFTEKGEVAIRVNGIRQNENDFELEFGIKDTGIGIAKDKLNQVFDEYVQIENHTGKKFAGTGLGLAIVKKLVELQDGKINIESEPEKGTTVTVKINYQFGKSIIEKEEKNNILSIPEKFGHISVLIADDEEFNRFLLKNILQKWGIRFKEAVNGNEAIKACCDGHFDIVLMDINMPELNGIEAAREIFNCNPETKIVAVTAVTDGLDKETCIRAGMKNFLFKPFTEKELFDLTDALTGEKSDRVMKELENQKLELAELRHLAGGDEKFLAEMISLFIKSMETGISGIEDAVVDENWNLVYENAHKMAAPVKHIGDSKLFEKIKNLEKMAKEPVSIVRISAVFHDIKEEIGKLNLLLKSYLEKTVEQ